MNCSFLYLEEKQMETLRDFKNRNATWRLLKYQDKPNKSN